MLPASLYATLGLHGRSAESADASVALALEEHLVWAGIRLKREWAAEGSSLATDDVRTFVTNDRLDADLAPRSALVSRIGVLLGISDQIAEVATTLLETHIDSQVLNGQQFAAPGLSITGSPQPEPGYWMLQEWLSKLDRSRFALRKGFRTDRRPLSAWLGWSAAITARPPLPYRIFLLVAADLPNPIQENVPWTDVSLGSLPSAGTNTAATE